MGRISRQALFIVMSAWFLWMPATYCLGAELIAPTRALKGENQPPGKLSIFSEPPGLGVTLDGKAIGKTPLSIESVSQGTHLLRVENKETTIIMGPGEARRFSFFKGVFIEMQAEPKTAREPPTVAAEKPVQASDSEQTAEKGKNLEPGYFPLNPRGPLY